MIIKTEEELKSLTESEFPSATEIDSNPSMIMKIPPVEKRQVKPSVNWVEEGVVTPPKNQKVCSVVSVFSLFKIVKQITILLVLQFET